MVTQSDNNEDILTSIKQTRQQLESRIKTQSLTQQQLISSLQPLVPDLVSSLDLSQKVISAFNGIRFQYYQTIPPHAPSYPIPKIENFDENRSKNRVLEGPKESFSTFTKPKRRKRDAPMMEFASEEDGMREVEALLSKRSFMEQQKFEIGEELMDIIHRPTHKEAEVMAQFKSKGGSRVKEQCEFVTREDCRLQSNSYVSCAKVHLRRIIALHTDTSLGMCPFLNNCHHLKTCRYVHYEVDTTPDFQNLMMGAEAFPPPKPLKPQSAEYCSEVELGQPQWINCDIRSFQMDILGKFGVIMADPPWDIHMDLPYGTMADEEVKKLNVAPLQTDGLIFLWVTARAMELGRECLALWGYKCIQELIWVKTNQLQQIIRTGRTGYWLNHTKEHCLVGIKGSPEVNRNIDTDVIVSEVRETSRKPDEMYALLERISPRTRKLELFARMHNARAGWISLGNQLNGIRLVDEDLRARFRAAYPDKVVQPPSPAKASGIETESHSTQPKSPHVKTNPKHAPVKFVEAIASEPYASGGNPIPMNVKIVA